MSHLTPKMKPSVPLDVDDPIDNEVFMITKLIDQPLGNEVVDILKFKTEISPNPTEFKHHKSKFFVTVIRTTPFSCCFLLLTLFFASCY